MSIIELVHVAIYLIVLGVVVWLIFYVIDSVPIPDPLGRVIRVVVMVLAVLIAILVLLSLIGVSIPVH